MPPAGGAGAANARVVSGPAARGAPAALATAARAVVPACHQAQDVQLEEEAARTPPPATTDQTLSRSHRHPYLTGIGSRPPYAMRRHERAPRRPGDLAGR